MEYIDKPASNKKLKNFMKSLDFVGYLLLVQLISLFNIDWLLIQFLRRKDTAFSSKDFFILNMHIVADTGLRVSKYCTTFD